MKGVNTVSHVDNRLTCLSMFFCISRGLFSPLIVSVRTVLGLFPTLFLSAFPVIRRNEAYLDFFVIAGPRSPPPGPSTSRGSSYRSDPPPGPRNTGGPGLIRQPTGPSGSSSNGFDRRRDMDVSFFTQDNGKES